MTRVFFLWPTVVCAAAIVNSSSTQHPLPSLSLQLQRMEPSGHGRRRRYLGEHDSENPPEVAPIFPGYGTHYAYVYVGTPPQVLQPCATFKLFVCLIQLFPFV